MLGRELVRTHARYDKLQQRPLEVLKTKRTQSETFPSEAEPFPTDAPEADEQE